MDPEPHRERRHAEGERGHRRARDDDGGRARDDGGRRGGDESKSSRRRSSRSRSRERSRSQDGRHRHDDADRHGHRHRHRHSRHRGDDHERRDDRGDSDKRGRGSTATDGNDGSLAGAAGAAAAGAAPPLAAGPALGHIPAALIGAENFSTHATQFRVWLKQRGLNLFDLPKDTAKAHFATFVSSWNAGGVDAALYAADERALQAVADRAGPRTAYTWGFAAALPADDRLRLDSVRDAVRGETDVRGRAIPVHVVK